MAFTIFNSERRKAAQKVEEYFGMLSGYQPTFRSLAGGIYEMDLTRACVDANARFRAKLKPRIAGSAYKNLERRLQFKPNDIQDTFSFLYKLSAISDVENNAFILPIVDRNGYITGLWPARATSSQIMNENGNLYWRGMLNGKSFAVEYKSVGHVRRHYYTSDFYGDSNKPIDGTLRIIDAQRQAIENGVAASSFIRFIGKLTNILKNEDITKERERFADQNLKKNSSGLLIFDNKYSDIKAVDSKPYIVNPAQMAEIRENAHFYFGTNDGILKNQFSEDEWNAYYEGAIEPWAVHVSLVLTNMMFSDAEIARGNSVLLEANRLQYASNGTKLNIVQQLFDRGLITTNQSLEIFNMSPVPDGDKRYIRKEYAEVTKLGEEETVLEKPVPEPEEDNANE